MWLLGYLDQAGARIRNAVTLAQEVSHPLSLALALLYLARFHLYRGEVHVTQERAEAAMTICTEQGFVHYLAQGTILQGWALAAQCHGEEGIAQIGKGLDTYQSTGAELGQPFFLYLLAEALSEADQIEEGLTALGRALSLVDKNEERWIEAELYRLEGELLLRQTMPEVSQAARCFQQALDVARRQQAKSWELRAAMSLTRLWQSQGQCQEATDLLAPVYGWFTEGFDTADLQKAKALLEELS